MSRSIHKTYKDLKGLTKSELEEQFKDPESDLAILGHKSFIKKEVKKDRKNIKITKILEKKNGL